jgi:hypothetical protein
MLKLGVKIEIIHTLRHLQAKQFVLMRLLKVYSANVWINILMIKRDLALTDK